MIKLIADQTIEADVITIPYEGMVVEAADSKATPKMTHSDPMIKYIAIIIVMLPVMSMFA